HKTRSTVPRGLREVSASPDRLAIAIEKHGQRPAAVLTKMVQSRHVDLVNIGPLLAVDFDVDEQFVHDAGDLFVFEAFVRHDMAPVAGCVAYREQNRLVALLGLSERVRTPGPPVDRIGLVLQQIRTRLMGEAVFARMGSCGGHGFRWLPKSADWQNLPIGMSALGGLSANRKRRGTDFPRIHVWIKRSRSLAGMSMYNRRDTIFALS